MDSIAGIPGNVGNWTSSFVVLIKETLQNPEVGLAYSLAGPLFSAGSVCEAAPGCSSIQLPT